jgi:hypothetical protein
MGDCVGSGCIGCLVVGTGSVVFTAPMNTVARPQLATLDLLIILMAKWYLLADAGNGILLSWLGLTIPLSALYKSLLLVLIGAALCRFAVSKLAWVLLLGLGLLAGPLYSWFLLGHQAGFSYDAGMVLKLLSPLLAALYFFQLASRYPAAAKLALKQIFLTSFAILVVNIVLGRLGFGFSAYLPNDYLPDLNLGTKGYFKATNELSALLLVLTGFLLALYWQSKKWAFTLIAGLAVFVASSMLTKTGMVGVLLLIVGIPLLQSRQFWQPYQRYVFGSLLLGSVLMALLLWQLPWVLSTLGVGAKLQLVYQQQGLLGVLLSSRDLFAIDNWTLAEQYFSEWHRFAGIGVAGLGFYTTKPLAEIDPFDLMLWFGAAGVSYFVLWFALVIRQSLLGYLYQPTGVASGILLVNLLLLLVATLAGHTMTAGMLWIPWGMLNGAVWLYCSPDPHKDN